MSREAIETITISKTLPTRIGDAAIGGHNYADQQGAPFVRLGLRDAEGERRIDLWQGDTVEFAGVTWEVTTIDEPSTAARGSVATLTRVSMSS